MRSRTLQLAVAVSPSTCRSRRSGPVADETLRRIVGFAHGSVTDVALARAQPGRLKYGTPGNGSSPHIAAEMFARAADQVRRRLARRRAGGERGHEQTRR